MGLDPGRTVAELRELHELTGDERGAQRVCWTKTWARAREWFRSKLDELPLEVQTDEAGNLWATLPGRADETLVLGGHLDSVPNGGWLDGALDALAALEVVRRLAQEPPPPLAVRLVDWADEEGARFGRSLFGSSAAAGTLEPDAVRHLVDSDGVSLPEALAGHGVDLDRATTARGQLAGVAGYLELHIEQGPVLESLGLPLGAVVGCFGLERHVVTFRGQSAHAGSTPFGARRDAFAAAARLALETREIARRHDGLATTGSLRLEPGIPTAVAGLCELVVDFRRLDADALRAMVAETRAASERIAGTERVEAAWTQLFASAPVDFDADLVALAEESIRETAGRSHRVASGPLHDATEMARAGIPTAMIFVQSLGGLSHTREEDTRVEHLELAVVAFDRLVEKTLRRLSSGPGP